MEPLLWLAVALIAVLGVLSRSGKSEESVVTRRVADDDCVNVAALGEMSIDGIEETAIGGAIR